MPYAPGPIVLEPLPLGPRVSQPGAFLALAAELVTALDGADVGLRGAVSTLAPLASRTFDPAFDGDLAGAADALDGLDLASDAADVAAIAATVDAVGGDVAAVAIDLPSPDDDGPDTPPSNTPDPGDFPGKDALPPRTPAPAPLPAPPPGAPPDDAAAYYAYVREAIRQLYLELLEREPDPGGWDHWTNEVLVNGHTLDWVREQGYASQEYREKHGG